MSIKLLLMHVQFYLMMLNSATHVILGSAQNNIVLNRLKLRDKNYKIFDHLLNAAVNPPAKGINCKLDKRG